MPHLVSLALALMAQAAPPDSPPPSPIEVVSALENALADAIEKAQPSVVAIARVTSEDGKTLAIRGKAPEPEPGPMDALNLGGDDGPLSKDSYSNDFGSGVVVGERGEILTAYHVVEGAAQLVVRASGRQAFYAEIIAADPRSDLAVIVPRPTPKAPAPKLKPLPLGDASKLRQGAFLIALGNAFNTAVDGRASASWGILANTARRLVWEPSDAKGAKKWNINRKLYHFPFLLQLDAKLNVGMSGGAVVNAKGELVGITTASADAFAFDPRAGYAIPIDRLGRRIVETLRQGKEVEYGFLGIGLDPEVSNKVQSAVEGTPAALGSVVAGDLIVGVGDTPVGDDDGLSLVLSACPPGQPITLRINHEGRLIERTVVLAKLPVMGTLIATNRPEPWRGLRVDYTTVVNSARADGKEYDIIGALAAGGVRISEMESGSPAETAGLKTDMVITHVEDRPVRTPAEFAKAVAGRKGPVVVTTGDFNLERGKKVAIK
jgi:serine protease Do